ncbi:MAG: tRNA (adenosine(37)-N6)-dimethylallyltransferase MiaA [Proteobacteria bacterium]|nr:tRNA (adenosine(37)-N6)-dimethylallyltransferase MiaA [Pseudomonadota bacterium]
MTRPSVLAIVGPTGTGKSALALEAARRVDAEILSADSLQVYRGMDIGTAKPSARELRSVPHHGIDIVDPDDPMTAGRFADYARTAARGILERGRRVLLCGGTGLYARAFAGGLIEGTASDSELRKRLERLETPELIERLRSLDPRGLARIDPRNRVRLVRALEICELAGQPASELQTAHAFRDRPFEMTWLGLALPREDLWRRLRARVDQMFERGLAAEVERLYARGYGPELPPLRALGYREVGQMLRGELTEPQARERTFLATRRFAKRQQTWFGGEAGLRWLDASDPGACLDAVLAELGG